MEIGERGFCFRTMETVTKTPIGCYALPEIAKYSKLTKSKLDFEKIYSKIDKNEYNSISEWYNDIYLCLSQILRLVGKSTPFGLVCSTLMQNFNEILQYKANAYLEEELFIKNTKNDRLMYIINDIIANIPNTQKEMPDFISNSEPNERKIIPKTKKHPRYGPDEIADIFHELSQIDTDEEIQNILRMTSTFEKLTPKKGVMSIDLAQVSPFTLELIKKHLSSCAKNP